MKKTLIDDPIRNPFHNRFHVPVHSRLDEMQAHANVIWLKDQAPFDQQTDRKTTRAWWGALAGAFALVLVVVLSAAFLSRVLSN